MKRRLLSAVTAVALLMGMLPMGLSPVSAASTTAVEYTRLEPEVAILNAFTAADSNFYEKLKGATRGESGSSKTPYPAYNSMAELFGGQGGMWSSHPSFPEGFNGMTSSFTWAPPEFTLSPTPSFEESTLKRIMQTFDNLAVKVSGEFQNYTHKHTFWKGVIPYEREVTNFLTATLDISGNQSIPISGLDGIGLDNYRDGDDNSYLPIFYHEGNNDVSLNFTKAKIDYYNGKYCTCNGANANHMLITFRDKRAPQLTGVFYSANGTSWKDRYSSSGNWQLGAGDDLYIKLSFDEPIRFSDDNANGKNSLKIGLKLAGKSVRDDMYANLYKLDTDALYFKYTVPDDMDLDEDIISLDLSSLFGNDLSLVQMQRRYNDGHFTIENDVLKELGINDTYGFNTTDCYVTDIAGNALVSGDISNPFLHIDTQSPVVETIDFGAVYNNDDVNKALGEDDELNLSGLYLGEGDSINMKLVMSEPLNLTLLNTEEGYYRMDWKYAKATTNIYKKDGTQVVVKSRWFTPSTPNKYLNTKTTFVMESIPIEEGMYVQKTADNPTGEVRVECVDMSEYGKPITDMKGNAISVSDVTIKLGAGSNPPKLDTTRPTVQAGDYIVVDDGFRQQVNIADKETGVSDIYGKFVLTQAGDSNSYTYQWAVSADPDATKLEWKVGTTGVAQEFKQKETTWIHIKPDDSTQYDNLGQCTMTVYAKDLAGNTGELTMGSDKILWYVDNRAPKATAGETRKVISGDVGTLESDISFDDSHQISAWEYAWSSDNTTPPTAWETGGGITEGYTGTSITVTASKQVESGSKFEGYLWVRATDDSTKKNQSKAECIGKYAYDLTAAKYALSYSAAVTEKASLKVSQLDVNDALVFMIPVQNTENQYSVLRVTADNFEADKNIFEMDGWENWYVSENGGIYTMTAKSDHSISNVINGTYAGNLEVRVLSGKKEGLVIESNSWDAGSAGYTFSMSEKINLRLASNKPWRNYSVSVTNPTPTDYIRLTTTASTGVGNTKQIWDGAQTLHSTLAGCEFDITIDQDRFGWNGDDIDCRKSKLVVTNTTEGTTNEIPLTAFSKNTEGKWSQKIIVSGDYTSGVYTAVLKLVSVTGAETEIPITGSARTIVVDATEPNENLTLSSIINDRFSLGSFTAYGVEDIYPERECIKEGESVIELPIGAGYFDRKRNQSWAQSSELYKLTFTSENEPNRQSLTDEAGNLYSYIGQYYVEVWTEDNPDKKVKFNTESAEQTTITNRNYRVIDGEGWDANGFSILDKDKDDPNFVYLTPDTENKVYFRKVYANGRTTQTQSVFIKPVNEQLKGTMSLDKENKKLVFTPTTGDETSIGATVYAYAYQNGQDYTKGEGERIPMDYYDGAWTCDLKQNGAIYRVVTINSHGSIWASEEDDEIRQLAPYLAGEPTYIDNGDGTYKIKISLYDDYDTIKKDGLMLSVGFNNDYTTEPYKLEVTKDLFDEYNPYIENMKGYSKNGIYRAEVSVSPGWQNENDYLTLTIDGVMMKKNSDSIEDQNMRVTVTAVDAYGNRMETSIENQTVRYETPKVIAHELTQDGLKLTFNQPVRPADSWAWQESEQKEVLYQKEWAGAFPVAANGTYEIEFRDVFGNICTDTLTTDDFTVDGIDWSLDLTFSETELTKDPIFFTAEMPNNANVGTKTAGVLIYDKPTITTLVPEGNYNGYPHTGNSWISFDPNRPWSNDTKMAPSSPRTVKLEKNTELRVFVYNSTWVDNYNNDLIFSQPVYINNIANEAPEAKVYYYHPMIGSDMSYEQLEQYIEKRGGSLQLEGSMQVTYKTSRSVTPTNDSGSVFFFTPTNYTASHTFSYIDDMGHSGSAEVSLPNGLKLVEPAVPYEDKTPPSVKVALSAKTNGSYTEMESFIAGETAEQLKEKVLNMDAAQGYSLKVSAQDESGYTMTVTEADGVSVMGNMILVDKPSAFTVTVTDKSDNENATDFSMTADMFEKMDNIPPTAEIDTQSVSMYEKKLVVQLRDTNNKGEDTTKDEGGNDLDSVTLISPSDAVKVGPNKYEYTVKENGKVDFVFRDRVGNRNSGDGASATVSGIDTDPPKLKLTWAPPLSYFDDETNQTVIDYSQPTWELVSTDVTAFVDVDKAMYKLTIAWGGQNPVTLLEKGMPTENNPYVISDAEKTIVTVSATTERITVVYAEGFGQSLDFTAYAANGKSSKIDVQAWVNIDKIAPQISAVQESLYRQKDGGGAYSVPYAVKVTFTPDEWVFSDNYGGTEMVDYGNGPTEEYKYFSDDEPLVLTFTENGNYNVRFSDDAGNVTVERVTISGIDRVEPNITLGELSGGGQSASIPVTVDKDCIVSVDGRELAFTAGVEQIVTFNNNGSYTIVATDSAGNKDERVVTVGSIDRIVPSITFNSGTIYVLRNSDVDEYNNQLNSGYTVRDNKTAVENLTVNYDASAVKLDTAGMYTVVYTVTDEAGNENQASRFVQVIGEDTTCICIDGVLVMPDSTAVIKPGTHTLTLKNGNEPYSIKARKGIRTSGQMKYLKSSSLSFDENGEFAVSNEGYYTVQVTTQSRKVIRIKLYVEQ